MTLLGTFNLYHPLLFVECDTCGLRGYCYVNERPVVCGYCRSEIRLPEPNPKGTLTNAP